MGRVPKRGPKGLFAQWLDGRLETMRASEVARGAGISESYVGLLKRGARKPSYKVVRDLARAMGVDGEELDRMLAAAGFTSAPTEPSRSRHTRADRAARVDRDLAVIARIAAFPAKADSFSSLLCQILDAIAALFRFDYAHIALVDADNDELELLAYKKANESATADLSSLTPRRWKFSEGVTGWVASTGQLRRVADVATERRFIKHWSTRSELAVPLVAERVIGVINVESFEVDHFTEHDELLLTTVAATVASALRRDRDIKRERWWQDRFAALATLHRLKLTGDPAEPGGQAENIFQQLVERPVELFPEFDVCKLRLYDEAKQVMPLIASAYRSPRDTTARQFEPAVLLPVASSISGQAVQSQKPITRDDVQDDPDFFRGELARAEGLHSMAVVPIFSPKSDGAVLGCLAAYATSAAFKFRLEHERLLEDIARFAAIVLTAQGESTRLRVQHDVLMACRDGARMPQALRQVCGLAAAQSSAQGAVLYLVEGGRVQKAGDNGTIPEGVADSYLLGSGLVGYIAQHGKTVRIVHPNSLAEVEPYRAAFGEASPTQSVLAVPIQDVDGNTTFGVLQVLDKAGGQAFSHVDQRAVEDIAGHLGMAIAADNKRQQLLTQIKDHVLEPISAIEAISRTLIEKPGGQSTRLQQIQTIALYCADTTRRLRGLDLSTLEPDVTLAVEPHSLREIVVRAASNQPIARMREITIDVDKKLGELCVAAHVERMVDAYASLIENAVVHAEPGTSVRIFLYGSDGLSCRTCVQHFGPHIDDNDRKRMFEATSYGAAAFELMPFRSGIGLTTARVILRLHRGDISVVSIPDPARPGVADVRFYVETQLAPSPTRP